MRRKLLIGNWKMYKTVAEARAFAERLGQLSQQLAPSNDYAVCAPFTCLHILRVMLPANVRVGAQNVHPAAQGAFTGEISTAMLKEFGTTYVIVGHSERRSLFGESDEWVGEKVDAVLAADMTPVLCVGEDLAEREAGQTLAVVQRQLRAGLAHVDAGNAANIVIAYEPVWAIGTGKTASAGEAQEVIAEIRSELRNLYGETAAQIRILYGGSVKPDNIAAICSQPDIDGALVGGASLDAESFAAMAAALVEAAK